MIVMVAGILGALWGGVVARRRKGTGLDIAQYAAGYGIVFMIAAMFLTILIQRLA